MRARKRWAVQLIAVLLLSAGCGSHQNRDQAESREAAREGSYCLTGGRTHQYSCDPDLAESPADMHPTEIDEDWMYRTLGEIKQWIQSLKQAQSHPSPD